MPKSSLPPNGGKDPNITTQNLPTTPLTTPPIKHLNRNNKHQRKHASKSNINYNWIWTISTRKNHSSASKHPSTATTTIKRNSPPNTKTPNPNENKRINKTTCRYSMAVSNRIPTTTPSETWKNKKIRRKALLSTINEPNVWTILHCKKFFIIIFYHLSIHKNKINCNSIKKKYKI